MSTNGILNTEMALGASTNRVNAVNKSRGHVGELDRLAARLVANAPVNKFNEIIPFEPNAVTNILLSRLQNGSRWLSAQHLAWLEGNPDAASDERFSVALAAWGELERSLRLVFGYDGCACGPDRRCPEDAPVICDFCMER
jgi:hypothetical protein